jgi:peptidoglycan hydrolase-like protein with peptidoglycan-binding domain
MFPHTDLAAPARWRTALTITALLALLVSLTALSGVASAAGSSAQSNKAAATTLKVGSRGAAVKKLQRKLHVQVTGYYGSQTKAAVKRYQRANGLKADGIAGPATLRSLGVSARSASYESGGASYSEGGSSSSSSSGGGSKVKLPAKLKRIAQCESGGDPTAISPDGRYRGKYQFDRATWKHSGGKGDPAAASEATQDRIALKLYRARGTAPWPNCGKA